MKVDIEELREELKKEYVTIVPAGTDAGIWLRVQGDIIEGDRRK